MREFAQTLAEFVKGLRPDAAMPYNSGYATELYNSRCGVAGLEVPPLIAYPISGAPTVSWPLPQLIKIHDLALTDTSLYFSRYAAGVLTISKVNSDYSLTSVFTKASINQRFTVADFGYYQIWAAAGLMIKRQINTGLTGYEWTEVTVDGVAPPVNCVCNFRGQLIAGIYTPAADTVGGTKDNLVAWSEIGSVHPTIMFDQTMGFLDRQLVGGDPDIVVYPAASEDDGYFRGDYPTGNYFKSDDIITKMGNTGGEVTAKYDTFIRFPAVTIPAGAVITSAFIRFTAAINSGYEICNLKCYFNNVDNAVAPTTNAEGAALVLTSPVDWSAVIPWVDYEQYDSPNLAAILQTVINRVGWATGQAVQVVIKNNVSSDGAARNAYAFDNGPGSAQLHVTYAIPSTAVYAYKKTSGNYRTGPHSVVYRVLPLGNGVMVYCADKIFYMKAVSSPEPTFGIIPVANFGIPSTFCVEGDEHEHVFIDTNKQVWKIEEGQKPKLQGYREFIGAMTGTIVISKNPNFGDYYISNGVKTYLLSPFGLSEWFQYPTSLVWEDANKRLIGPIAVSSDVSASMATDIFDFGVRSLKTIAVMEIGATGQVMTANIDFKYKVTEATFTASRFKTASNFGAVTPIVSGTEFKFRVKGADYTKFNLDYLNIRYKYVDKRMIRGVYATDAKVLSRSGR